MSIYKSIPTKLIKQTKPQEIKMLEDSFFETNIIEPEKSEIQKLRD
jgi:hypothetical protein